MNDYELIITRTENGYVVTESDESKYVFEDDENNSDKSLNRVLDFVKDSFQ
jgi:hypothetical protein